MSEAVYDIKLKKFLMHSHKLTEYYKGVFATEAALNLAIPVGEAGWNVKVTATGTIWVWDMSTSAWTDTDHKGDVTSVNNQIGDVSLTTDNIPDYTDKRYVTDAEKSAISGAIGANALTGYLPIPAVSGISHEQLGDLYGGGVNDHQHLTTAQVAALTGYAPASSLNSYLPVSSFQEQNNYMKEPTGFLEPQNVIINYDPTTQTVAVTGTTTAYWRGSLITGMTAGLAALGGHENTTGHYYWLYSDDGSTYKWMTDAFPGFSNLLICYVYYGATNKYAIRECHGLLDWRAHEIDHEAIGTYKSAGGTLTALSYTLNSTNAANRRPTVDETTVDDEDLHTVLPAHTSKLYTKYNLTGSATPALGVYTVETADIVLLNGNIPYYNQFTGGAWQQTPMANNEYQALFLYAIPVTSSATSQKYRYIWVQGQTVSTTLSTIQAIQPANLNLGTLNSVATEFIAIVKVIIRYVGGGTANWSIISVDNLTGNKFTQIGSPAGNYLSTVATDSTLSGNGTAANPIGLSPLVSSFTSGALVSGILNITHTRGTDTLFSAIVDNGYNVVLDDRSIHFSNNAIAVDLSQYAVTGTWSYKFL